jgi:hypothetical protein
MTVVCLFFLTDSWVLERCSKPTKLFGRSCPTTWHQRGVLFFLSFFVLECENDEKRAEIEIDDGCDCEQWSDWYSITRKEMVKAGGRGLLKHFGSPAAAIMTVYPHFPWIPTQFASHKKEHTKHNTEQMLEDLKKVQQQLSINDVGFLLSLFSLT